MGTSENGVLDLLNHMPGVRAEAQNLTLQEMRQAIDEGKQVLIPHNTPGGGHIALLNNVEVRPDGRRVLIIDDPGGWGPGANAYQHQKSDTWYQNNTRTFWGEGRVIVVDSTGTLPRPSP